MLQIANKTTALNVEVMSGLEIPPRQIR